MDLATPVKFIKGVGPGRATMFEAKGLHTVEDLLSYFPFRYEDRSNMKPIAQLAPGEMATVVAEVRSAKLAGFRRKDLGLFEAVFSDASRATLHGKWFHGKYLAGVIAPARYLPWNHLPCSVAREASLKTASNNPRSLRRKPASLAERTSATTVAISPGASCAIGFMLLRSS